MDLVDLELVYFGRCFKVVPFLTVWPWMVTINRSNGGHTKLKKKNIWKKMQLDVDVSPPANIMTLRLGLTHVTSDLDPCDLWPWPIWPFTSMVKWDLKSHFWPVDLDLWPWPSRSTFDLSQHDLWPWPLWPLTSKSTCKTVKWDLKSCLFDLVTSTFDLRPWPSRSTLGSSMCIFWPNFMTLRSMVPEIWIFV